MSYLQQGQPAPDRAPGRHRRRARRRPDRPGVPELQRRPAPRGLPGLHPQAARARLHGRADASPAASTPAGLGMSCLIPLVRAGVRRLDRLDRREPLPRHPLRPRPAAPPEPPEPRRLRAAGERHHPDLRHRLRLQDAARHRRLLPRADPQRGLRPADGDGRVPPRGRPLPPRPRRGARAAGQQPARRRVRGGGADLHVEPRRQLDRHEPRRARIAEGQAPDRPAPRRQRDGGARLPGQARRAASRAS